MPYKSLPLGAFWTIFGRNFPTGVLQLLYPYQPANPLVESIFKALKCFNIFKPVKNHSKPAYISFPGSESIQFDMEKLFLLDVSKENFVFRKNKEKPTL